MRTSLDRWHGCWSDNNSNRRTSRSSQCLTITPLEASGQVLRLHLGHAECRQNGAFPAGLSAVADAQRLPGTAIPEHYDLAFDVDLAGARFEGTETIRGARSPADHARRAECVSDHVSRRHNRHRRGASDRRPSTLDPQAQTATFTVSRPIPAGPAEINIRYTGALNDQLRGFYLSRANGRRYAVSQLEATDARRAFPCFDEPALKATFAVTLTIDSGDTAISNGRLLSDTPGPGAGRHTLTFATSPKMSSYLVALAVGDFECVSGASDNVPIRVCAVAGQKDLGRVALESAEFMLALLQPLLLDPLPVREARSAGGP